MNILFICDEYPPEPHGGLGSFVQTLATQFSNDGNKVIVFGWYHNISQEIIEGITPNLTIIKRPYKSNSFPRYFKFLKERFDFNNEVLDLVNSHQIDIIEYFDNAAWDLFNRSNYVIRLHSSSRYTNKKRGRFLELIENINFKLKTLNIIGVSQYILSLFKNTFNNATISNETVIYNGVNFKEPETILTYHEKQNKIYFAGTLKPVKGIKILIEAYLDSPFHSNNYILNIFGNDTLYKGKSYKEYLIRTIPKLSDSIKNGTVVFRGFCNHNELTEELRTSKFSIFPSLYESFGLVAVESMSQGCVTLFSDVGPAREIIDNNVNGYIFKPNDKDSLIETMNTAYNLSEIEYDTISKNSILKAKVFSIEKCASQTLEFYKKVLKQ